MKKTFIAAAITILLPAAVLADTISSSAGFVSVPVNFQSTTGSNGGQGSPFWNNNSMDGANMNAGYFLTGSNLSLGSTNYLDTGSGFGKYLSTGGLAPDAPASFSFLQSAVTVEITLLYSNAGANMTSTYGTQIGFYNVANPSQKQVIFASGTLYNSAPGSNGVYNNNLSPQPTVTVNTFANYGIYATTCGFNPNFTVYCNTYHSDIALNPGTNNEPAHQHFALFQNAVNPTTYIVGFEDVRGFNTIEGYGDFNDAIFRIATSTAPITETLPPPPITHNPEPATWTAMGLGLLGIGLMRRRATRSAKANA